MSPRRVRWAAFLAVLILVLPSGGRAADFDVLMREAAAASAAGDFAAAEDGYRQALVLRPGDPGATLRLGLNLAYQGHHRQALDTIEAGLAGRPGDFDLRLAAARIKAWMGRTAEALDDAEAVLRDFPGNSAALALKGRILIYRGDAEAAEAAFSQALEQAPDSIEARKGLADARELQAAARRGQVALTYSRSSFSRRDQKDWTEVEADAVYDLDETTRLLGFARLSHRFGQTDTYLRAGGEKRLGDRIRVRLRAGVTPGADFLAKWTVEGGASLRVSDGGGIFGPTEIFADLEQSHYATGNIRGAEPGVQQYLFDGRTWVTARWLNSFDATADKRTAGWSLRGDWQLVDRLRLFAGYADAPEVDRGVTVDTLTRYAGAVVGLTDDVDLTFAYTRDNRKDTYIRDVVSATLGYRF